MIENKREMISVSNFSIAFEQFCSFKAISEVQNANETLQQLILQCLIIRPGEKFQHVMQFVDTINSLFGLQISEYQIQEGLDRLLDKGLIEKPMGTNFVPSTDIKRQLQNSIDEAKQLEENVKQQWLGEISTEFPSLPLDQAWKALRAYLAKAFRRHGIQTVALLDPTIDPITDYSESLSSLLNDTLQDMFSSDQQSTAKAAISKFLATVGSHANRATYIAQLGDGAFNYFSLTVAPEVAQKLQKTLNSLVLFLDTNVLFGILDLHDGPFIEVSNELLRITHTHNLPFKLRYHQATERELRNTITNYGNALRSRHWKQGVSRIASSSPYLSGLERKYHQLNAEAKTDIEAFLKLYEHVDILLKEKKIEIYRPQQERTYERSQLFNAYKEFLLSKNKEKVYQIIDHDTTVLDTVRQLRSNAKSSLQAGALLITCDYYLYRFDWETSRSQGKMACAVLPNHFLQVLRPFIPASADFDKSFAETFAIPEFRTIGNGLAAKATSRLISVINLYKNISEDTAMNLLSNSVLIDRLSTIDDDEEFQEEVESVITAQNLQLLEEKAALEKQIEQERINKALDEEKLEQERIANDKKIEQEKKERAKVEQLLQEHQKQMKTLKNIKNERDNLYKLSENEKRKSIRISEEIKKEKQGKIRAEEKVKEAIQAKKSRVYC